MSDKTTSDAQNINIKITKTLNSLRIVNPGSKFSLEVEGRRRKTKAPVDLYYRNVYYDEHGLFLQNGEDICDCLRHKCPGCFYPCKKCNSTKCGHACRRGRVWYVEKVEIEGTGKSLEMNVKENQ